MAAIRCSLIWCSNSQATKYQALSLLFDSRATRFTRTKLMIFISCDYDALRNCLARIVYCCFCPIFIFEVTIVGFEYSLKIPFSSHKSILTLLSGACRQISLPPVSTSFITSRIPQSLRRQRILPCSFSRKYSISKYFYHCVSREFAPFHAASHIKIILRAFFIISWEYTQMTVWIIAFSFKGA